MSAKLCIAIPAWNREKMLEECLSPLRFLGDVLEIVVIDDRSSDETRKVAEQYAHRIIDGPGACNWRPGAIHWPVFHTWLTTKCPYISYIFSDDIPCTPFLSSAIAFLEANVGGGCSAVYGDTLVMNEDKTRSRVAVAPPPGPHLFGGIPCYTESLVIARQPFIDAGGCDFPIHCATMAEAWIWAAAGASGRVIKLNAGPALAFREHPGTLSVNGPDSDLSRRSKAVTGFGAEEAWVLWQRAAPTFQQLVAKAKAKNS
jgi:glycosyltransferase involved in cell wall biosynthesis